MRRFFSVLALLILAGISTAAAQTRGVTGRVVDAAASRLEGVEVLVIGTTVSVHTNAQGVFTLSVPAGDVELMVRMIGYRRAMVTVPARTNTVDVITLEQDVLRLDEVVVTGLPPGSNAAIWPTRSPLWTPPSSQRFLPRVSSRCWLVRWPAWTSERTRAPRAGAAASGYAELRPSPAPVSHSTS